jgi:FkbM family methyltransferase
MDAQLDFALTPNSVVVEVGGWRGEWAAQIIKLYDPHLLIFEPIREYYEACLHRFGGNTKVHMIHKGLGLANGYKLISKAEQASSFFIDSDNVELVEIADAIDSLPFSIDLLALNCEGYEYGLLPYLIESKAISRCQNVLVQFHSFMERAESRRDIIRKGLLFTHEEIFCVPFGWEAWRLR